MLVSKLYAPTLREVPAEAVLESHKLMLRAGYIRKIAGGLYTYLPLAWKSIKKIERSHGSCFHDRPGGRSASG